MRIVPAYRAYMEMAYFAALRGDFNFDGDYDAYCAMAACDVEKLEALTTARRRKLGVKPSQVKFHKKGAKSFENAKAVYNAEYDKWCADPKTIAAALKNAPVHLVKVTGTQAKKAGGNSNLTAHYSVKRPRKVESAFGEADNTEVF